MSDAIKKLKSLSYSQMIALGFFLIILLGTFLLMTPIASKDRVPTGFTEALFTATSATCVTGLVLYDTFLHWSLFGQIVIICLIQVGGLGFMSVITLFSLFMGRRIGLKERHLLRESVNTMYIGGIVQLFRKILIGTCIFEGAGALILSIRFVPMMGWGPGIYSAIFHSVSAFCNAGFDLMGRYGAFSSLTSFSGDGLVCITIMVLIVVGGIGFFVWDDIMKHKLQIRKYQMHTKIVLATTGILIVSGAICFFFFEYSNLLTGKSVGDKILISLFSSITPRTAGFNSINVADMTEASKLMTIVFMFIGGSPGSTAGGIKTTTLAVLCISLLSSLKNTKGENAFGRQLEENALKRASAVLSVNMMLMLTAAIIICATNLQLHFSDVLFESASALGTVGLSTGITNSYGILARLIITFLMYSGRVGSLTFALIFTEHRVPSSVQRPTERINIG